MRLLHCDVFPIRFALIYDEDEFDRLAKRLSALVAYPGDGAARTYFSDDYDADGAVLIVVLGDCSGVDPVEIELLLVHESVHCAQNVFDLMAEDAAGTEIEAYTVQYFTRHLILLAYGFVGPLATQLEQKAMEGTKIFNVIKVTLLANLNGYAPAMAVEFGRKVLDSTERPGFAELEEHVKQKR